MENQKKKAQLAHTPVGPVAERGAALLTRIYNEGGLYLTQDEAKDEIAAGNITANEQDVQGDRALCMLTNAGASLVTPATVASSASFEIDTDVPMPTQTVKRGGKRGSKYPFDDLPVGGSFHVPVSADMPDPVAALASSITGARRRHSVPMVDDKNRAILEDVEKVTYEIDQKTGKRVKDANGKWIVTGKVTVQEQKMKPLRDFMAVKVGAEDKKGPGARVFRKL